MAGRGREGTYSIEGNPNSFDRLHLPRNYQRVQPSFLSDFLVIHHSMISPWPAESLSIPESMQMLTGEGHGAVVMLLTDRLLAFSRYDNTTSWGETHFSSCSFRLCKHSWS